MYLSHQSSGEQAGVQPSIIISSRQLTQYSSLEAKAGQPANASDSLDLVTQVVAAEHPVVDVSCLTTQKSKRIPQWGQHSG